MKTKKPKIEDTVFLKTDIEQLERIITGYTVRKVGIVYELTCGVATSWHYDFEFTPEKKGKEIGFK